jgi:hypothetical protein
MISKIDNGRQENEQYQKNKKRTEGKRGNWRSFCRFWSLLGWRLAGEGALYQRWYGGIEGPITLLIGWIAAWKGVGGFSLT